MNGKRDRRNKAALSNLSDAALLSVSAGHLPRCFLYLRKPSKFFAAGSFKILSVLSVNTVKELMVVRFN